MEIPFLSGAWASLTSKILSVGLDFRFISGDAILESLDILPAMVENVSFSSRSGGDCHASAASFREEVADSQLRLFYLDRGVHHFNGTMRFNLASGQSHQPLLSLILELGDFFKFNLKYINYRLTARIDISPLASLMDECKDTLQFLDIIYSSSGTDEDNVEVRSFDFSHHHALRRVRIWTPAAFDPNWLHIAISSIYKPSSANPRVPSLRIELHISLPPWMLYQDRGESQLELDAPREVEKIVTSWVPVDKQLSRLIGFSPGIPSGTSLPGVTTAGITLDVSVTKVSTGPGNGVPARMFPLLSDTEGLVRLV